MKVNILERDSMGHCEKTIYTIICIFLNGYPDRAA